MTPHLLLVFGKYPCGFTEHAVNTFVNNGVPFIYRARGAGETAGDFLIPIAALTQKRTMPAIVLLERHKQGEYKSTPFTENSAQTVQTILLIPQVKEQLGTVICRSSRGPMIQHVLTRVTSYESALKRYRDGLSFVFCPRSS